MAKIVLSVIAAFALPWMIASAETLSGNQVRRTIILDSIAAYPGSCACPYSVMRNGRHCGRRSAYSKPGGHSPRCYPKDISDDEVSKWRHQHKDQEPDRREGGDIR